MKKLISILGAVGITATASSAVVSCGDSFGTSISEFKTDTPIIHYLGGDNDKAVKDLKLQNVFEKHSKSTDNKYFEWDFKAKTTLPADKTEETFNSTADQNVFRADWDADGAIIGGVDYGDNGSMEGTRVVFTKDTIEMFVEFKNTGDGDYGLLPNEKPFEWSFFTWSGKIIPKEYQFSFAINNDESIIYPKEIFA